MKIENNQESSFSKKDVRSDVEMAKDRLLINNDISSQGIENLETKNEAIYQETALSTSSLFNERLAKFKAKFKEIEEKLLNSDLTKEEKDKLLQETKLNAKELKLLDKEIHNTFDKKLLNARNENIRLKKELKNLQTVKDLLIRENARNWEKDLQEYMRQNK